MTVDPLRPASPGALFTDLYQLTMLQAYFDQHMDAMAVFEFFCRGLPSGRSYHLAAGQALRRYPDPGG